MITETVTFKLKPWPMNFQVDKPYNNKIQNIPWLPNCDKA